MEFDPQIDYGPIFCSYDSPPNPPNPISPRNSLIDYYVSGVRHGQYELLLLLLLLLLECVHQEQETNGSLCSTKINLTSFQYNY